MNNLKEIINKSKSVVFFGGAGVSTESGIPDFRSKDGLYNQQYKYPPEEILSHTFFINHTAEFYEFYKAKMNSLKYKPNVFNSEGVPKCTCGGIIKPDVVLYEEGLNEAILEEAIYQISNCDILIVGGTSLTVYPACGSLCVARIEELPIILEFTSFQDTIMFHKRGRFGLEKVQKNEIHVKVVLDMECGNI